MSIVSHIQKINESAINGQMPTLDEVEALFQAHLNKRASKERVDEMRQRLLSYAKPFLQDTKRLNKLLDDPESIETLNTLTQMKRPPRFWASKGLSIPLLQNAIHQLQVAKNVSDTLLAIYGLLAITEDTDTVVPSGTHTDKKNLSVYHYLTQIAGWAPEKRNAYMHQLNFLMNTVLRKIAERSTSVLKATTTRRPLPIPW